MEQPLPPEAVPTLHELDLGHHLLLLQRDGSMELIAHEEQAPAAICGVRLTMEEAQRLLVSLQEQFQPQSKGKASKKKN